jgi:hypothetical protein
MEKNIAINQEYNSLDKVLEFVKKETPYECLKEYDSWDIRIDENGQMEKCIVIKKSAMHGTKLYFTKDNKVNMKYIIPNKVMHAYFGKSVKAHRNILELIAGTVKGLLLANSQKKAFEEMEQTLDKIIIEIK